MLHADEEYKDTNQTKVTSLSEKVEVLGKSNRGMNTTATRYYSVNDWTIFFCQEKRMQDQGNH